jgi:hypothetical protein
MVKRFIVGAGLLAALATSITHASPNTPIGYALPDGCHANVSINTGRGFPSGAIETILDNHGSVRIDGVGPDEDPSFTVQLTITRWTLYEDSELWGDLRDYEVEGTCLPASPTTIYVPIVNN